MQNKDIAPDDAKNALELQARAFEEFSWANESILGFYMSGSFGRGMHHAHSDLDPVFITEKGKSDAVRAEIEHRFLLNNCDLSVYALDDFAALRTTGTHGYLGSCRYDYAHVTAIVDKTAGRIQAIIDSKGRVSDQERDFLCPGQLDGYINAFYRSLKAKLEGWDLPQRLEAAESVPYALSFLFNIENRVVPYSKYLEWDMTRRPLRFPMPADELLSLIKKILSSADIAAQIGLFRAITIYGGQCGLGRIVADWEEKPERLAASFS